MGSRRVLGWRAVVAAVLTAAAVTACGGGAPSASQTNATPTTTSEPANLPTLSAPPATTPTPGPSPTASPVAASGLGEKFDSQLFDYSVSVPRGWSIGPGQGKIGPLTSDVFTGPKVGSFVTNVNIVAEPLPSGVTNTASYFKAQAAGLQAAGIGFGVVGSVPVGADRATLINYSTVGGNNEKYVVHQVVLVMVNRGWIMTLSTAERATEAGLADFKSMLKTFTPKGS